MRAGAEREGSETSIDREPKPDQRIRAGHREDQARRAPTHWVCYLASQASDDRTGEERDQIWLDCVCIHPRIRHRKKRLGAHTLRGGSEKETGKPSNRTQDTHCANNRAVHQMIDMIAPGKCGSEDHSEVAIVSDDRQKVALEVHFASESMMGGTENDDR